MKVKLSLCLGIAQSIGQRPGFDSRKPSRLALRPNQPPTHWIPAVKVYEVEFSSEDYFCEVKF